MCDNANSEQDPWLNTLVDNTIKLEFEDKFVPKLKNEFKPLDDSLSYIANLGNYYFYCNYYNLIYFYIRFFCF